MLIDIHLKLQILKTNVLSFEGLNIMVIGNFMQSSQVNDLSLYFSIMQPTFSFIKQTKKTMMGKNLRDNSVCSNNIMLTQQLKQAEDVQYSNVFQNICNIFTKIIITYYKHVFSHNRKSTFLSFHRIQLCTLYFAMI
jgi:hypothetical protein